MVGAHQTLERPAQVPASRDRNFLRYLGGVAAADVGDQAWLTVLAWTAAQTGRPVAATLVLAAGTVPRAVLALVGGAVADRLPSRPLLIGANGVRVLVLLAGVAGLLGLPGHTLAVAVGVAVLFGAADALHIPAIGTMPRQLVDGSQLLRAASMRQLVQRLASIAGPSAAGFVLAAVKLPGALLGLAALFAVAAVLLTTVRIRHPRDESVDQPVLASIRDVLGYLRRDRNAGGLVLALVGLNVFVIPVVSAGVALRAHEQSWGPETLGLLLGAVGLGAVVGTVCTLRIRPTHPLAFALLMLMLQGGALAVVGAAPLVGVGVALGVVGLTSGLASPLLSGTLQATVDQVYLGRVFALISLSDNGLIPLSLVGFGALSGGIGVGTTSLLFGAAMVLLMFSAFVRPTLRRLRVDEAAGTLAD